MIYLFSKWTKIRDFSPTTLFPLLFELGHLFKLLWLRVQTIQLQIERAGKQCMWKSSDLDINEKINRWINTAVYCNKFCPAFPIKFVPNDFSLLQRLHCNNFCPAFPIKLVLTDFSLLQRLCCKRFFQITLWNLFQMSSDRGYDATSLAPNPNQLCPNFNCTR